MDRDITAMSSVLEHCDIRALCDIMKIPLVYSLKKHKFQNKQFSILDQLKRKNTTYPNYDDVFIVELVV
jgi:hypothetical protein